MPNTARLTDDALAFLTERHLAMLTTLRADGSPHVVAVGFTFERSKVGVLSQVDGARWLSLEGIAGVNRDPDAVRDAELRYAQRYRTPRENPQRVVIEVIVKRVLGSSTLLERS
jgi:general stress protein 26